MTALSGGIPRGSPWGWEGAVSVFEFQASDVVLVGEGACGTEAATSAAMAGASIVVMTLRERWPAPAPPNTRFDLGTIEVNLSRLAAQAGARLFLAGDIPEQSGFRADAMGLLVQVAEHVPHDQAHRRALMDLCSETGLIPASLHDVARQARGAAWPGEAVSPSTSSIGRHWQCRLQADAVASPRGSDHVSEVRSDAAISPQMISPDDDAIWICSARDVAFDTAFVDAALLDAYRAEGVADIIVDPDVLVLERDKIAALCRRLGIRLYDAGLRG